MKAIIPNPRNLEVLKNKIKGYGNLHVISDFDRTLTYGFIDGKKTPSIISILRDGNYLEEGYSSKAHAFFDKYHPIEIDPNIPLEDKRKVMKKWWDLHNRLLIESNLSKSDLQNIVDNGHVRFREGINDFLDILNENNIPLIIFSASGCGDAIEMFFDKIGRNYSNIYYVTNKFDWNEKGTAISVNEPVIHCMNKDETILKEISEIYNVIKNRKNVILLGDSVGDLGMVEGFDYENLIKAQN